MDCTAAGLRAPALCGFEAAGMLVHRRASADVQASIPHRAKGTNMSPAPTQNKTVIYLLGGIAVLLVVLLAVLYVRGQGSTVVPDATAPGNSTETSTPASMPGVAPSTGAEFDPAAATKVPADSTPEAFVKLYYQSILDKKWDVAFKMQPAASQKNGTVEDFQATQTGYGLTAFKVLSATAQGDTATVDVEQNLGANGTWGVIWTFVKFEGAWVVKSRQVQMK
jgi:hypothetical protein